MSVYHRHETNSLSDDERNTTHVNFKRELAVEPQTEDKMAVWSTNITFDQSQ